MGFGSLGDAITYAMEQRHERNEFYRSVLADTGMIEKYGVEIERIGGLGTFEKGLYASSEFITDGFIQLMDRGIIKRKVYDNEAIQNW